MIFTRIILILSSNKYNFIFKLITYLKKSNMQPSQQNLKQNQQIIEQNQKVEGKPKISPELVKKYRQIFDSYDKQQDGYVQAKDIPGVMKILGVAITEQQVVEMLGDRVIKSDSPLVSSKVDFTDFLALIVEKQNEMSMKEELMQSFRVFDTDKNGFLPVSEFRYYLRSYGITMAEDQVEELIKETEPQEGYVKYEKFIDKMLGLNQA